MNVMVGYFSRRKVFHIVEWFETYDEAIAWLLKKANVRKDFVIYQKTAQQGVQPPLLHAGCGGELKICPLDSGKDG